LEFLNHQKALNPICSANKNTSPSAIISYSGARINTCSENCKKNLKNLVILFFQRFIESYAVLKRFFINSMLKTLLH